MTDESIINKDDIGIYLESISELPVASKEEQAILSDKIKSSFVKEDVDGAINKLVLSNVKLVFSRAKKFHDRVGKDISLMEYISDGNLALIKAARSYDASKSDACFSTYATSCIDKSFFQTMRSHDIIRVPTNQTEKLLKVRKLKDVNIENIEDNVIKQELNIGDLGIGLLTMAKNVQTLSSLDKNVSDDDQGVYTLLDTISDDKTDCPQRKADLDMLNQYLLSKMRGLSPKEQEVLRLIFFDYQDYTLDELSRIVGVCRSRVDQIYIQAMKKLRKFMLRDKITKSNMLM